MYFEGVIFGEKPIENISERAHFHHSWKVKTDIFLEIWTKFREELL